ncbi:MAG TPA: ferritin [Candidatus Binatia bacterium]|jgi:ferritin|nr:ferritin [Candidatus Binatia bacterium]
MLISNKMNAAINQQIGNEFGASLQYVAIASRFAGEGLNALAGHFYLQAEEERDHAMRFVRFLSDAGGKVEIPTIPAPRTNFKNAADAVRLALNHEMNVTSQINGLVDLALKESDHISRDMLSWFVKEQLEEVSSMDNLLKVVQRAGESNLIHVEDYITRLEAKTAKMEKGAQAE